MERMKVIQGSGTWVAGRRPIGLREIRRTETEPRDLEEWVSEVMS